MKPYLGICLVLLTLAGVVFFTLHQCTEAAAQTVERVRDAFASVLQVQPEISINQRTVYTQTAPIAELAIVTKEELVSLTFDEHEEFWSYTVPMTGKTLEAEATYRLKAGFDLHEPFSVTIDPATHAIHAVLPHAKILSVEQVGDLNFKGDDSLLNRITDAERTKAVNGLADLARRSAENSGLKADAETQVTTRLQELLRHNGQTVDLTWAPPSPSTTPPAQP